VTRGFCVEVVHLHIGRFVDRGQACRLAGGHQVARHLGLAIDHHLPATGELLQVDAVALSVEEHVEPGVHQSLGVHALAHARLVQQVGGDLFQHAGADAAQHVLRALAFQDDGVDAGFVQQLTEQQAGGACTDDGDLGSHGCLLKKVCIDCRQPTSRFNIWMQPSRDD
jgi:hypothetical protein